MSENKNKKDEENKKKESSPKMKLYVRIDGISPFVLQLHHGLQIKHYKQIVEQYYDELYEGRSPGQIYLSKTINFNNGDKIMEFKRRESLSSKFDLKIQLNTSIYSDPPVCHESITMADEKSVETTCPNLCYHPFPKFVSLNRLIKLITDPYSDDFFLKVWFYQYREILKTDKIIFLNKLIQRFEIPNLNSDQNYSFTENQYFNDHLKMKIKTKICNILYQWVKNYFFDFDDEMIKKLEGFCTNKLIKENPMLSGIGKDIIMEMRTNSRQEYWENFSEVNWMEVLPKSSIQNLNNSNSNNSNNNNQPFDILSVSPKVLADSLTFIDYHYYNKIHFTEMLGQAWSKDKRRHKAPFLMRSINFLNLVSNWVSFEILREPNEKKRLNIIKYFHKLFPDLQELNSLNVIQAVHSGLDNSAVYRLKFWDQLDEKILNLRNPIKELVHTKGNFKNMRIRMQKCIDESQLCSPFIGILLKDIVFYDDGKPKLVDGKINFGKLAGLVGIMNKILRFQKREYLNINPSYHVVKEITQFKLLKDEELYKMSLKVKPRGR